MGRLTQIKNARTDIPNVVQMAYEQALYSFKDGYPHPFPDIGRSEWGDTPRTIVELKMCALSEILRNKPNWWEKKNDVVILQKWREEALEQGVDNEHPEWTLTGQMIDYVLAELDGYARLRDGATGVEPGCYERVWKSDALVSSAVRDQLLDAVAKLENIPEDEKDWHPGTNKQVLDLVHPSLYPIVYGRTLERTSKSSLEPDVAGNKSDTQFLSRRFQWIPSNFEIDASSAAKLKDSYINNLHPVEHAGMYPVIENLVGLAVPMWERVLSDLRRPLTALRMKVVTTMKERYDSRGRVCCIWADEEGVYNEPYPSDDECDDWEDERWDAWRDSLPKRLPEPLDEYNGALDAISKTVDLTESTIQVIVKLANILLTPNNPTYEGGSWHVEGMLNESIVSTFLYYYDEDNITQSELAFRVSVTEPCYHGQDDSTCTQILYGLDRQVPLVQEVGRSVTKEGRCIAFPNIYQHQVQPFRLADPTKPGHRKIVALFLVDPTHRIPSTADVAPQQHSWAAGPLKEALAGHNMPAELADIVSDMTKTTLMTRDEAEVYREELMKERSVMVKDHTKKRFHIEFNMCEH
ncbi:hypothetical protein CYLTODRAFT_491743 [Cylindrobasidium torrendii FP15055 ss-10]|uniref:Uncharacterized protein n=1 Tax=Cylindrobasidium torrendii FP15055 ss-10 TaxID=1314674 RepID=A0A0D7B6H7_9AGAR|nr:hypothetical protein CYLTODRAFT_491743 [Cylindrobasidium torrendii FP15055 ss-10]